MQLIVELPVDAEEYIVRKFQHSIAAPAACPHCRACASLQALGYYLRSITGKKAVALTISGSVYTDVEMVASWHKVGG